MTIKRDAFWGSPLVHSHRRKGKDKTQTQAVMENWKLEINTDDTSIYTTQQGDDGGLIKSQGSDRNANMLMA